MAYLSFILAARDDDYGGDQKLRVQCFIDYLSWFDRRYPGMFELVVCDWNPPSPERTMAKNFDWSKLADVSILTVSQELHARYAGDSGYPILDYVARNVAIRNSDAQFVCVTNQDIYPTAGILSFIAERRLEPSRFYRADRCDFVPDFERMRDPERIEELARSSAFEIHRRHGWPANRIDVPIDPGARAEDWEGSVRLRGEAQCGAPALILDRSRELDPPLWNRVWNSAAVRLKSRRHWNRGDPQRTWGADEGYLETGLHTNACGDFLIAAKRAFEDVWGFPETDRFYMHLDSYCVVQLRAAGYRQAIFGLPNAAFHADHDRSGREGRRESHPLEHHAALWMEMLRGRRSPRFNGPNWGLADFSLPTLRLRYGKPTED